MIHYFQAAVCIFFISLLSAISFYFLPFTRCLSPPVSFSFYFLCLRLSLACSLSLFTGTTSVTLPSEAVIKTPGWELTFIYTQAKLD